MRLEILLLLVFVVWSTNVVGKYAKEGVRSKYLQQIKDEGKKFLRTLKDVPGMRTKYLSAMEDEGTKLYTSLKDLPGTEEKLKSISKMIKQMNDRVDTKGKVNSFADETEQSKVKQNFLNAIEDEGTKLLGALKDMPGLKTKDLSAIENGGKQLYRSLKDHPSERSKYLQQIKDEGKTLLKTLKDVPGMRAKYLSAMEDEGKKLYRSLKDLPGTEENLKSISKMIKQMNDRVDTEGKVNSVADETEQSKVKSNFLSTIQDEGTKLLKALKDMPGLKTKDLSAIENGGKQLYRSLKDHPSKRSKYLQEIKDEGNTLLKTLKDVPGMRTKYLSAMEDEGKKLYKSLKDLPGTEENLKSISKMIKQMNDKVDIEGNVNSVAVETERTNEKRGMTGVKANFLSAIQDEGKKLFNALKDMPGLKTKDLSAMEDGGKQLYRSLKDHPSERDAGINDVSGTFHVGVTGEWGNWEAWTGCTVTCGEGTRARQRICNIPAGDSVLCLVSDKSKRELTETGIEACNSKPCRGSNAEGCFPSDALARNDKGLKVAMKDLKVGEKVLTMDSSGRPVYSEITMMLHRDTNRTTDFVTVSTRDHRHLTLTSYHLIPLSTRKFIFAKDVEPGHIVTIFDATQNSFKDAEVTSVHYVTKTGIYAPLSMEGTLIVDDVYVSCYATFPSHSLSHLVFSLWRNLYSNFNSLLSYGTDSDGIHWYPSMLLSAATYANLVSV